MSDDEARAAQYRVDHTVGALKRQADRFTALPGDPAERTALEAAWEPWIDRVYGWDPPLDADEEPVYTQTPIGPVARGQGRQIV